MAQQTFRIVLVVGENHQQIIKKYSADTIVESHLYMKKEDAAKQKKKKMEIIKEMINMKDSFLTDKQKAIYNNMLIDLNEMTDFEYFTSVTEGCTYDETTGDAYTTTNPNAYYKYERCPQATLLKYGEESPFANPFILKDGTTSYTAKVEDIDWCKMHMSNTLPYEVAWETVMEGRKPKDEHEERIYSFMKDKRDYFVNNFNSKEEYIKHSCSFWCYGIATEEWYKEVDDTIKDIEWTSTFYNKYIKTLNGDEILTIYEVKAI